MEADDEVLLVGGEVAPLDVRAEVVDPPQATALPAPQKPCSNTNNDTRGPSLIGGNHRPLEGVHRRRQQDAEELTCVLGEGAPVGVAMLRDVVGQPLVLLGAPRAPLQALLLAARRSPHEPIQTDRSPPSSLRRPARRL